MPRYRSSSKIFRKWMCAPDSRIWYKLPLWQRKTTSRELGKILVCCKIDVGFRQLTLNCCNSAETELLLPT
ncbi:hypothetical protein Y032_0015g2857 [Ancylostoma ceylanicum]|uniref:Uncharacterized protein n=1 Tax=Ancylostoma ceylanicum TaxID=53326 RepID=A0A016V845_9BILA|nr:hypothetical protein Y032_0015g2857 [Ancylostoma ceylanicum]